MIRSIRELPTLASQMPLKTIAVAAAENRDVMELLKTAEELHNLRFTLVGDQRKLEALLEECGADASLATLVDQPDHGKAAAKAVELTANGSCDAVMKGNLHTSVFLKAVLNKDAGLSDGRLISQITVYDRFYGEGIQMLTDCAMAIAPTLEEKAAIIQNAVELCHRLGIAYPKVAVLSALEVVNPKMPDTVEAAILSKMADRGQIKGCMVDGPFALDNAASKEAAAHKGIKSPVAGDADILLAPDLLVGNALFKSLVYFAKADSAAVIMGARRPVIMTSRTDTVENKLLSILFSLYQI